MKAHINKKEQKKPIILYLNEEEETILEFYRMYVGATSIEEAIMKAIKEQSNK